MPNSSSQRTKETVRNLKKARNNLKQMDRDMFAWEQEQKKINIKKLKNRLARKKRKLRKINTASPPKPISNNDKKPVIRRRRPQGTKTMISGSGKFTLWVKPGFKVTSVRVLKRRLVISASKDKKKP
tara:strand:+ start:6287 stop:6667 length:381 start_codon:yes stop_codon:yes gene_type:complete